ncbi:MAG: hypothetical protein ACRDYX_21435, partial [Egibacteraceae bacterium]
PRIMFATVDRLYARRSANSSWRSPECFHTFRNVWAKVGVSTGQPLFERVYVCANSLSQSLVFGQDQKNIKNIRLVLAKWCAVR